MKKKHKIIVEQIPGDGDNYTIIKLINVFDFNIHQVVTRAMLKSFSEIEVEIVGRK